MRFKKKYEYSEILKRMMDTVAYRVYGKSARRSVKSFLPACGFEKRIDFKKKQRPVRRVRHFKMVEKLKRGKPTAERMTDGPTIRPLASVFRHAFGF